MILCDPYEAAQLAGVAMLMQIAVDQSAAARTEPFRPAVTLPLEIAASKTPARDDPGGFRKTKEITTHAEVY